MPRQKPKEVKRVRVLVSLPEELAVKAKHAAIDERRPLSHILANLIARWLAERERRKRGG